eukprot:5633293-Pleurochrysis_carterae.AAC.1
MSWHRRVRAEARRQESKAGLVATEAPMERMRQRNQDQGHVSQRRERRSIDLRIVSRLRWTRATTRLRLRWL